LTFVVRQPYLSVLTLSFVTMSAAGQRTDSFQSILKHIPHIQALKNEQDRANIENFVGYTKVPIGLAGPLRVQGPGNTDNEVFAPLATVEPTLVASCSRGSKALHQCGGVHFRVLGEGMSRAPVFIFADTADAVEFAQLLPNFYEQFCERCREHKSLCSPPEVDTPHHRVKRPCTLQLHMRRCCRAKHGHHRYAAGVRQLHRIDHSTGAACSGHYH
jgi:hydroxymethylglutaryl-CoA reductase